ncbi:MAG: hypothetical protein KIT02_06175 [Devosia sp.]|uniref:hypothetical protein n=1 Tax=Devosia sp. TaxID=1871048 RepID=UPI0024C83345|nr:hypothetical protein [Devosia sp.]UYO00791.1 MAG: hypothetical protein KIT02_06175 [Devosia sp.]
MQIDRRWTTGLAWAGAALVVGIPAIDFLSSQFSGDRPQAVVVQEAPQPVAEVAPVTTAPQPSNAPATVTAPETTASITPAPANPGGDAVDSYLASGKPLPSYISGGDSAPATPPAQTAAKPAAQPAVTPQPASNTQTAAVQQPARPVPATQPAATAEPERPKPVAFAMPTPLSQRPAARPATPVPVQPIEQAQQPPLIVEDPRVVTAEDLADWESGPLSEFLNNRQRGNGDVVVEQYEPEGFWLDQSPRPRRPQPVYEEEYFWPFGQ